MKGLRVRLLAALTASLWLFVSTAAWASEVCRLHKLVPFEASYDRALAFLPRANTSDPKRASVYIESTANGFYYQSNFQNPGYPYPTKVGSPRVKSGTEAFLNIIHTEMPSSAAKAETYATFRDDVHVYVDKSVFDANGLSKIDLEGVKHLTIVDGKAGKVLLDGNMEQLDRNSPPPLIMSKVVGCCLFAIPPHFASRFGDYLRARPFKSSDVSFMSLVRDSGTETAITQSATLTKSRASGRPASLADIDASFKKSTGKTVVLIGHVEGESFVRRDATGKAELSVPIQDLRATAKKYNIELIDLGCKTAQEIRSESLGLGVTTRFNTVDAVRAMDRAMANSKNYEDFFAHLTSDGLKVVVDPGFVREKGVRASIYSRLRSRASDTWVKIAEVFVSYREKA